ncbi:MAG: rhodanese-like domain-containing protein [bacterium]|nr:rhodanese-like domain-containing protein [bacterium]
MNPAPAETITLTCEATDADGDELSYAWRANGLPFGADAAQVQWQAPASSGLVTVSVTVSDGIDTASRSLPIQVGQNEFALLTGVTDPSFPAWNVDWLKEPTYVYNHQAQLFIVDLRSSLAYANGHITGARNTSVANLAAYVAANNSGGDEIALVCDTGQIAAFAAMGLRMLGHDAFCMKWGMAGWNDLLAGPWDSGISNQYANIMSNSASPNLPVNNWPTLATGLSSGQAILQARVAAIFAEGFGNNVINAYEVMDSPGTYHIHNYWVTQDYEDVGHIAGSYQLTPGAVTTATALSALHPTQINVLYCWTGHTSAFVGFYLNVLGYDLLSMRFGANALMHDDLPRERWVHQGHNFPTVTN